MINLVNENAPQEIREFVSACVNEDDLVNKLEKDPLRLITFIENMKENPSLAVRLTKPWYKINLDDLEKKPEIKKVETTLRNRGMLNRTHEPDFRLEEENGSPIKAHLSILALESPYFKGISCQELEKGKLLMKEGLSPEVHQLVVDYLYLSDKKRQEFIPTVKKELLLDMAQLANYWLIDELSAACDEELCNSLGELAIEKSDIKHLLAVPKFRMLLDFVIRIAGKDSLFRMLLNFVNRIAGKGSLELIIESMQTPEGAARFASECAPEEIKAFAVLKTEFGKACRIPPGTFAKAEWEKTFPVTILEVPPMPLNIREILELADPYEPGKTLKETCMLFLRPEKVILHEKSGNKELVLGFDGVEDLAKKATNRKRRTHYDTFNQLRNQMNGMAVAASGWVLMRKEVIPGSRNQTFHAQEQLLKGRFEVPKTIDAILLNVITYASEGQCLFGRETYTRCQEQYQDHQIHVGNFTPSGLHVNYCCDFRVNYGGLSGVWKF